MASSLNELLVLQRADLSQLRTRLKKHRSRTVSRTDMRIMASRAGERWFSQIAGNLQASGRIQPDVIDKYSTWFTRLLKLSRPNNLTSSYQEVVANTLRRFDDELVLPIQTGSGAPQSLTQLAAMLGDIKDKDQGLYLQEAAACAMAGHLRASAVLGWCAAMDHIHKAVEHAGFTSFNMKSSWMASQTAGRFKKFSHPQNVNSISELREVFDTVVLWIVEGMGMIDSNEHTRLSSCFDLRCQCAHPGNAPVTSYNLMSFFSDLKEIVFANPRLPK